MYCSHCKLHGMLCDIQRSVAMPQRRIPVLIILASLLCALWIGAFLVLEFTHVQDGTGRGGQVKKGNDGNPLPINDKQVPSRRLDRRPTVSPMKGNIQRTVEKPRIQVSCVICGDRVEQALTMLKSLVIFTKAKPHVNIFAEKQLMHAVYAKIDEWPTDVKKTLDHTIYPVRYPDQLNAAEWKNSYWPCSTMRLFLPYLLPHLNASIYVDTDLVFMNPVEKLWSHFKDFSSQQIAAMTKEHEEESIGWYNRHAKHPYYGPLGANSAVMLMNFTRMREFSWMERAVNAFYRYKGKLPWTDQDIMNVIFHYDPDKVYLLPCNWNYRFVHCHYKNTTGSHIGECPLAEKEGANLIHGNDQSFSRKPKPAIRAIYRTMTEFVFGSDIKSQLLEPMMNRMESEAKGTPCWEKSMVITGGLKRFIGSGL